MPRMDVRYKYPSFDSVVLQKNSLKLAKISENLMHTIPVTMLVYIRR